MKYIVSLLFMLTIPLANFLISNFGTVCIESGPCLIPVGFGLLAPSGVLVVGAALVLRDWLQELTNWKWAVVAVLAGGLLSWYLANPYIAIASAVAFLSAEMLDLLIYTPLRKSGRHLAVLVSGVVGSIADSLMFVYLAFGTFDLAAGMILGKMYATLVVSVYLYWRMKYANKV